MPIRKNANVSLGSSPLGPTTTNRIQHRAASSRHTNKKGLTKTTDFFKRLFNEVASQRPFSQRRVCHPQHYAFSSGTLLQSRSRRLAIRRPPGPLLDLAMRSSGKLKAAARARATTMRRSAVPCSSGPSAPPATCSPVHMPGRKIRVGVGGSEQVRRR